MIIVVSKFTVANDLENEVAQAFIERPHMVDDVEGFQRLEVLRASENPREFWLLTYWDSERTYQSWYRTHRYQEVHKSMPAGLKLVPGTSEIRLFHHVAS